MLEPNPILAACAAADMKPAAGSCEQLTGETAVREGSENGFSEGRRGLGFQGALKVELPAGSSPESASSIASPIPPEGDTHIKVFVPKDKAAETLPQAPSTPKTLTAQVGSSARAAYNEAVYTPSMVGKGGNVEDDESAFPEPPPVTEIDLNTADDGSAKRKIKVFGGGACESQMAGSLSVRGEQLASLLGCLRFDACC